jgi:hypothetical protein
MNTIHSNTKTFIEFVNGLGPIDITHEDEAIAFCLNCPDEGIWAPAFGLLQKKYKDIVLSYIEVHHPNISAIGKDMILDRTFDRILKYRVKHKIKTKDGGLGVFVCLICKWEAEQMSRKENRRHNLLKNNFQDLWCVQRDAADEFRGDIITDQDVEDLLSAIRQDLNPELYPGTAPILRAISTIFLNSNGLQVKEMPANPSVEGIKNYLENHNILMTEDDIIHFRQILRRRAKTILEEHGWELNIVSKYAQ